MDTSPSRYTPLQVFVLAALLIAIFGAAGLTIVHLHRQMHQVARNRVSLEMSLARVEASILDCRGRIEQSRSMAVLEERRAAPAVRPLAPVRPERVIRLAASHRTEEAGETEIARDPLIAQKYQPFAATSPR